MFVRDAVAEDVSAIASLYLDSVMAAYSQIASDEYLSTRNLDGCTSQWAHNISDDAVNVVVAEGEGNIKGLASFGPARDRDVEAAGELHAIYVSPDYWGRGIGRQLCEHAIHRLYQAGNSSVLLWVLSDNARAVRFYERSGFLHDGKTKTVTMGTKLFAVRYKHQSRQRAN